jgi:hypothetical protein
MPDPLVLENEPPPPPLPPKALWPEKVDRVMLLVPAAT